MKLSALKERALRMGVDEQAVKAADDAEDVKAEVILLITLHEDGKEHVQLREELRGLKLSALKQRAAEADVDEAALREALQAHPLSAEVYHDTDDGGNLYLRNLEVGEEWVEWENHNGKSAEFLLEPPDDMRTWRIAIFAIGRLMGLLRRASARAYMPGGAGAEAARAEFEVLALGESAPLPLGR